MGMSWTTPGGNGGHGHRGGRDLSPPQRVWGAGSGRSRIRGRPVARPRQGFFRGLAASSEGVRFLVPAGGGDVPSRYSSLP